MNAAAPPGIPRLWEGKPLRHVWPYLDASGAVLGHVARFDSPKGNKECPPFFNRNNGTWKPGAPPEPRPLFGLPSLNVPSKDTALVCEGEKPTAAVHGLGLPCVCSLGGAQAASKANWGPLAGFRRVVILPDVDAPGESYAADVCAALRALPMPPEVLIARLDGLGPSEDAADWIAARLAADSWDGFEPVPREPGDELPTQFLEAVQACAEPAPLPSGAAPEPWAEPVPLNSIALPPWPAGAFPEPVQSFVAALAASTESPPELAAGMVLGAVATAVQRRYRIKIKRDFHQPLGLYLAAVLPPGARKSANQAAAARPLIEWQKRERERLAPEAKRAESELRTITARIENLRGKAGKAKPEEVHSIMQEIAALEAEAPTAPTIPRLFTDDCTPEHLAVLMDGNEGNIAVLSDEAGIFGLLGGRYNKGGGPNLNLVLQAHEGNPVAIDRGSRPSIFIEHPAMSFAVCLQPDVLATLQTTPEFRGRGLLGRFLWIVPESTVGRRRLDGPSMPDSTRDDYRDCLHAILEHAPSEDSEGRPCRHTLTLAPEAYTAWHRFALQLEAGMAPGGTFEYISDWAAKGAAAAARVAGTLHVVRHAAGCPWKYEVALEDMAAAVSILECLSRHALQSFDAMGSDSTLEDARAILRWIERERLSSFTRRDAHTAHRSRFPRAEALDEPLAVLEERGFIRPRPAPIAAGRGRPSCVFDVNPSLRGRE